ncbi:MAG: AAA family ATPase [Bacilli bacterium]
MNELQEGSMLKRYADELTAVNYITNPAIAREEELKKLMLVLLTPEKSAVLVGKPGIGKTAIVEGLAYNIQYDNVPNLLKGYRIFRVNTTALLGNDNGENRVLKLIKELQSMDKIILFIDEIHTLIGNDAQGALDLANMFKEGLSRGTIKMIGATTTYEYETYILRDKAFVRRFERIDVEEPTQEMCVKILMQTLPKLEKQTGAVLDYTDFQKEKLFKFIVNMTSEYKRVYEISSRYPDICLTILRQAFSNALFENSNKVTFKNIYDAIRFTKAVYPDVIKKELVIFKEEFKEELANENVVVDPLNYLN